MDETLHNHGLLTYLVEAFGILGNVPRDEFLKVDSDGDTPLHNAIRGGLDRVPNEVIEFLIRRSPEQVFATRNNKGKLPVHEAVQHQLNSPTFQLLLNRSPKNVMVTADKRGNTPIHYLPEMSSLEHANFVVDKSPLESLSKSNADGRWPLHCAVSRSVSLEVFHLLLSYTPADVMRVKDKNGQFALHMICQSLSNDIVQELLNLSPSEAFVTKDRFGRLPIHYLVLKDDVTAEITLKMIDKSPQNILSVSDDKGFLPIHAIKRRPLPLDLVELLIRRTPKAIWRPDQGEPNFLHWLVKERPSEHVHGASADVIMCVAQVAPELFTHTDSKGRLPIHCAIESRHSAECLQAFVACSPDSLLIADKEGRLPLHYASSLCGSRKLRLFTDHPSSAVALKTTDVRGWLPLNYALSDRAEVDVVETLLDGWPGALFHFDNDGHLPLYHGVVKNFVEGGFTVKRCKNCHPRYWFRVPNLELIYVDIVLERAPKTLEMYGPRRQLILHDIIGHEITEGVLRKLVGAYPEASKIPDDRGKLPLHYVAATKITQEHCRSHMTEYLNSVFFNSLNIVLDAFPGAVCRSDNSGNIPLFIACNEDAPLDIVFTLMRLNPDVLVLPPDDDENVSEPPQKKTKNETGEDQAQG